MIEEFKMIDLQSGRVSKYVRNIPRNLTSDEWGLIVKAVSAYQHNSDFRSLYEKLRADSDHANRLSRLS